MIQSLYCVQGSLLFVALWQKCVQRAADISKDKGINGRMTIDNVFELVWTPCYRRWQDLWMRIIGGEIRLKEVKEQFGRFVEDQKLLDAEIETTLACFSDKEGVEESDLYHRIDQIKQSLKLSECSDAVEIVLLFKNEMGIEGDFQGLEDFHDQVIVFFRCCCFLYVSLFAFFIFCNGSIITPSMFQWTLDFHIRLKST